jgi:polyisoprenyl-phosphate glycosyltransferase
MNLPEHISIIIPVFNEGENIHKIYDIIIKTLCENDYSFGILFVDDGSMDDSLTLIKTISSMDSRVKYISLSKNFGHQMAIKAGVDHSNAEITIMMDCDLQHPVEMIPTLIDKWREGHNIVNTKRIYNNKTSIYKKLTSKIFYKFINYIADIKLEEDSADFRLIDDKVLKYLKKIQNPGMFFRGEISKIGFKQIYVEYTENKRLIGKTKYNFKKMAKLAVDGITTTSVKPLKLATLLGVSIFIIAILYAIYAVYSSLFNDKVISGWASILISVLTIGGIQLLTLGFLGEYIGKIFLKLFNQNIYVISDTNITEI